MHITEIADPKQLAMLVAVLDDVCERGSVCIPRSAKRQPLS